MTNVTSGVDTSATAARCMMRPPKVVIITKDLYEKNYWPTIKQTLNQIISAPDHSKFSQEELYRHIYNLCCQRHTIQLHTDLTTFMNDYLRSIYSTLLSTPDSTFAHVLCNFFSNYQRIVEVVGVVFRYLEKVYIREKLNTSLKDILMTAFNASIVTHLKPRIEASLKSLPRDSNPSLIMLLVKGLYELDKDYSNFNPQLFAMYIPCLLPTRGIDYDVKETFEILEMLRFQGFTNEERVLKRKHNVAEST